MKNVLVWASFVMMLAASPAVGAVAFGTTQTFEAEALGGQPDDWTDGDTGWFGSVVVVGTGTDGVSASVNGGSQFVKITPGDPNSYFGGAARDAAYSGAGDSTPFPTVGDTYSVFRDVYFQPTTGTGHFWIQNTIRQNVGGYLTESSLRFTTGGGSWNVQIGGGAVAGVDLATGQWYTLEEIWDRSQPLVGVTYNIYDTAGALLYTEALGTYNNVASADLGGSGAHSWFTVWDNSGLPGAVYADNFGTRGGVIPEPAAIAVWSILGGLGLAIGAWRRRKA